MEGPQVIFWCGVTLCGAVSLQLLVSVMRGVFRGWWEWRIYRTRWQLVAQELRAAPSNSVGLDLSPDSSNGPTAAWPGSRKFRVESRTPESDDCVSIALVPHDGKPLPGFLPGQYVTLSVRVPGEPRPIVRCYTLSDCPSTQRYRLTIKRVGSSGPPPAEPPGRMSHYVHDHLQVGDLVDLRAPQGSFCIDPELAQDVVLIAGGVGITPMVSMINELAQRRSTRPVHLFYVVRNRQSHPFKNHLRGIVDRWPPLKMFVFYSRPGPEDQVGRDFSRAGRLQLMHLQQVLPHTKFDFYLCGPPGMMAEMSSGLRHWGVPEERIHTEAFGAPSRKAITSRRPVEAAAGCHVQFALSGKKAIWDGQYDNLIDLAESQGVLLDVGCRAGNCGTCVTAVRSGNVTYPPNITGPGSGLCLPCVAVPEGDVVLDA